MFGGDTGRKNGRVAGGSIPHIDCLYVLVTINTGGVDVFKGNALLRGAFMRYFSCCCDAVFTSRLGYYNPSHVLEWLLAWDHVGIVRTAGCVAAALFSCLRCLHVFWSVLVLTGRRVVELSSFGQNLSIILRKTRFLKR